MAVGTKLTSIEEKRKALEAEEKSIKESCEHTGTFVFDKICDYSIVFDINDYYTKVETKCVCEDCGQEFHKGFDNYKAFSKFRREQIKDRFDKKNLELIDFLNEYYLLWRKSSHNNRDSILITAAGLAETGEELQSVFNGNIVDGYNKELKTEGRSRLYNYYVRNGRGRTNKNKFVDEFLYKEFLATKENYKRLSELVDDISEPSLKIEKSWDQWTSRHNFLAGHHHLFREVFHGTKTVFYDIIRVFQNANHARLVEFGKKKKRGDDHVDYKLTDKDIAGVIKQACETYEKENGKKATTIIMGMPGKGDQPLFYYNIKKHKEEKIYMPNDNAEHWSFGEYWDFMKEIGTYKGLKVLLAYHVDRKRQVIACRMSDLDINKDKPFPKVANYYMLDTNVTYSGLYNDYKI